MDMTREEQVELGCTTNVLAQKAAAQRGDPTDGTCRPAAQFFTFSFVAPYGSQVEFLFGCSCQDVATVGKVQRATNVTGS